MNLPILEDQQEYILFFDGICGLCNRFVDFMVVRNGKGKIKFAALQGKTASIVLPGELQSELKTVVYYRRGKVYTKSSAAILVYADSGSLRLMAKILLVIPPFLRNGVYDFVAANRYKWFGKKETCRLPMAHERAWFLD